MKKCKGLCGFCMTKEEKKAFNKANGCYHKNVRGICVNHASKPESER